jgi:hypothetical protein
MLKIKRVLLEIPFTRELLFFVFQKKVYKSNIDRKIHKLLKENKRLSNNQIEGLIVSLTSFPERIDEIKYTIYSLLDQTVLPEKIILWLAESQFPYKENGLPNELLSLKKYGLDIRWCEDLKSYKKLIPAIKNFPDYFIVTADDDLYYNREWLRKIWFEHLRHPDEVICHLAKEIKFDNNNHVLPYKEWKLIFRSCHSSFIYFPLCGAGALFHRKYLSAQITNKGLFFELTPYADDIWFYFMIVLHNIRIRIVENPCSRLKYTDPYREYYLSHQFTLSSINSGDNKQNDVQFKRILNYYKNECFHFIK